MVKLNIKCEYIGKHKSIRACKLQEYYTKMCMFLRSKILGFYFYFLYNDWGDILSHYKRRWARKDFIKMAPFTEITLKIFRTKWQNLIRMESLWATKLQIGPGSVLCITPDARFPWPIPFLPTLIFHRWLLKGSPWRLLRNACLAE